MLDGEHEFSGKWRCGVQNRGRGCGSGRHAEFRGRTSRYQTEANGHERAWAVRHTIDDLVFHGLHGVVDGLAGLDFRLHLFTQLLQTAGILVERLGSSAGPDNLFEMQTLRFDILAGRNSGRSAILDRQVVRHDLAGPAQGTCRNPCARIRRSARRHGWRSATILAGCHVLMIWVIQWRRWKCCSAIPSARCRE